MRRLLAGAAVLVVLVVGALLGSALSQRRGGLVELTGTGGVSPSPSGERVRVEVLNGGGVPGAARAATDELRDAGFDVVYFGNADRFDRDTSLVLDRIGRVEPARGVADALGIRNVRSLPDSNLFLDVSVWLGEDWTPAGVQEEGAEDHRPWWDPRGWLPGG